MESKKSFGLPTIDKSQHSDDRVYDRYFGKESELGLSANNLNTIAIDQDECVREAVARGYNRISILHNLWIEEEGFWHISLGWSLQTIIEKSINKDNEYKVVTCMIQDNRDSHDDQTCGLDENGIRRKVDHTFDMRYKYCRYRDIRAGYVVKPVWIKAGSDLEKQIMRVSNIKGHINVISETTKMSKEYPYVGCKGFNDIEWVGKYPPSGAIKQMEVGGGEFFVSAGKDTHDYLEWFKYKSYGKSSWKYRYQFTRAYQCARQTEMEKENEAMLKNKRKMLLDCRVFTDEFRRTLVEIIDFTYPPHCEDRGDKIIDVTEKKLVTNRNEQNFKSAKYGKLNKDIELSRGQVKCQIKSAKHVEYPYMYAEESVTAGISSLLPKRKPLPPEKEI